MLSVQLATIPPCKATCPFLSLSLGLLSQGQGQLQHEAVACSVPHPVPSLSCCLAPAHVWFAALEPGQRKALSKVRWPQDLQLHGLALAFSQPYPHSSRSGGLQGYKGQAQHTDRVLTSQRAGEVGSEGDGW